MESATDSSPLQRFCTFWLGLGVFALFGVLALLAYKASGGDRDTAYEKRAGERAEVRRSAERAQADLLAATPVDTGAAVELISSAKPSASSRPVPGTAAFETKMKAAAEAANAAAKPLAEDVVELELGTLAGLKYAQTELTVKAGAKVALKFSNTAPDLQPHNFVLGNPGTKDALGSLADALIANPNALQMQFVPESDDIITSSKLLQNGDVQILEFTAPAEPGDYPYICTFPGHWRLMNGILKVTE